MALADRMRTVAITAVVTSVGWLAFGAGLMDSVGNLAVLRKTDPVTPGAPAASGGDEAIASANRASSARTPAPAGRPVTGTYILPVAGVRADQLTDTFSDARGGGTRVHDAIDIMAPRGTPVLAAAEGTVEKLFTSKAGGLTIYVRSPDRGTLTYYAHLDAYASGLAEGQRIRAGQQIGTVGFTGNSDPAAPHLHFAILQTAPDADWWEPAFAVNPYPVLTGRSR